MYDPFIDFSNPLYVATYREFFHSILKTVEKNINDPFRLHLLPKISFSEFTGCPHDLMSGSLLPHFFFALRNTATGQSMLGTSSTDGGLVSQYTHWYKIWVGHTSPRNLTQYTLTPHSISITTFSEFIPILTKASSSGTTTMVITATDISGSQYHFIPTVINWLVVPHINLTGGIFTTGTGLSTYIFYFVHRTTGRWYYASFTNSECDAKDTYVDALSTPFSLQNSMALFYSEITLNPHIILYGRCHITNWYCNNYALRMYTYTTWGTLASGSKIFQYTATV